MFTWEAKTNSSQKLLSAFNGERGFIFSFVRCHYCLKNDAVKKF